MKYVHLIALIVSTQVNAKCIDQTISLDPALIEISFYNPSNEDEDEDKDIFLAEIKVPKTYGDAKIGEIHIRKDDPFKFDFPLNLREENANLVSTYFLIKESEIDNFGLDVSYGNHECGGAMQYRIQTELKYSKAINQAH